MQFVGRITLEPQAGLSILIGEFLYELRASLENTIWSLAEYPTAGRTGYPVCSTEDCWTQARTVARYATVPNACLDFIHSRQPLTLGGDYGDHPLWQLDWLAKRDRHRFVTAIAAWNASALVTTYGDAPPAESMPVIAIDHFENDDVLGYVHLTDWWASHGGIPTVAFDVDLALPYDSPAAGRPLMPAHRLTWTG